MIICKPCLHGNHEQPHAPQICECCCHAGATPSDEAIADALIEKLHIHALTRDEVIGFVRDYFRDGS